MLSTSIAVLTENNSMVTLADSIAVLTENNSMVTLADSMSTPNSLLIGGILGLVLFLVVIITCIILLCFIRQAKKKKVDQ